MNAALLKIELMGYRFFSQPHDDVINSYQIGQKISTISFNKISILSSNEILEKKGLGKKTEKKTEIQLCSVLLSRQIQ